MRRLVPVVAAVLLLAPAVSAGARGTPVPRSGELLGTLTIPRLGLRVALVEGTGQAPLNRGAGHYPWTWLPGEGEVVGIAGHRTTGGAPFRNLDRLRRGDAIWVRLRPRFGGRSFRYRVSATAVVRPERGRSLVRDTGYERLVLSTCHPVGSSAFRLVVHAVPVRG